MIHTEKKALSQEVPLQCGVCNYNVSAFQHRITSGLYGKGICERCENEAVQGGYWTAERIKCMHHKSLKASYPTQYAALVAAGVMVEPAGCDGY